MGANQPDIRTKATLLRRVLLKVHRQFHNRKSTVYLSQVHFSLHFLTRPDRVTADEPDRARQFRVELCVGTGTSWQGYRHSSPEEFCAH